MQVLLLKWPLCADIAISKKKYFNVYFLIIMKKKLKQPVPSLFTLLGTPSITTE